MQAFARFETVEGVGRSAVRRKLCLDARLTNTGEAVVIHNISETGLLIETNAELVPGERFELELPETGVVAAEVIWNGGEFFGCLFARPIPIAAISAALLRSPFEQPQVTGGIDEFEDDTSGEYDFADERYPFAVRLRVILGVSIVLWALILWAIGVL